ncbi:hypothetical protein [Saccharopolyspora sp. NPDC049357]|uniref:hypothetical protein n=1 Tax=Saccharopolyspora sp. NPDC049357 TaxID=3154507 RepID=UPI0034360B1F
MELQKVARRYLTVIGDHPQDQFMDDAVDSAAIFFEIGRPSATIGLLLMATFALTG